MNTKGYITAVTATLCFCTVAEAQNMKEIIADMPDSIVPYLNRTKRLEMTDLYKEGDTCQIKNLLNTPTLLNSLSQRYAEIKLNELTTMQLCLLEKNDSTNIVCMATTYGKDTKETEFRFFDTQWKEINERFGIPDLTDRPTALQLLTAKPDSMSTEEFNKTLDVAEPLMVVGQLTVADGTPTIKLDINTPYLSSEEKNRLKCVEKQTSLKWSGEIFK